MLKNNAFKSFISVLFLLVGLFAWEKSASAALFDYNYDTNSEWIYFDHTGEYFGGLIYKNMSGSTLSITSVHFKVKFPYGNPNIYTSDVDCTTGDYLGQHIQSLNVGYSTQSIYTDTTFNYSTPVQMSANSCWLFGGNSSQMDFLYNTTGGFEGYQFAAVRNGGGGGNPKGTYLPYFKLYTGSASPSIEITNPPADLVINFTDFNYTFTATKDSLDTASAWLQLFWYDGATLSTVPQMTTQFNYPIGTTVGTGNVNTFTPGNGTYEVRATIQDTSTGITDVATRTVIINITGNPSNTLVASASASIDNYCDTFSTDYLCAAIKWLFVPNDSIQAELTAAIDAIKETPPISYGITFTDAITGNNATNSAGFDVIPSFINTFFAWLWWIGFVGGCYHLGMHLFRT